MMQKTIELLEYMLKDLKDINIIFKENLENSCLISTYQTLNSHQM
jgi:hypothetical protein